MAPLLYLPTVVTDCLHVAEVEGGGGRGWRGGGWWRGGASTWGRDFDPSPQISSSVHDANVVSSLSKFLTGREGEISTQICWGVEVSGLNLGKKCLIAGPGCIEMLYG